VFCPRCGSEYAGNPNFCGKCGANLSATGVESPQKPPAAESKCPYCQHTLEKRPLRKTKCPNCGNYIYVKRAPTSQTKELVTEQRAAEIEKLWEAHYQQEKIDADPEYKQEYERTKAELEAKGGFKRSDGDIRWAVANKQLLRYATQGDWGLYRNVKLDMAQQLKGEKKLKDALRTYLEICYLDVNGPNNLGGERDPDMLKSYPPFDPTMGFLAPRIIWEIGELSKALGLQADEVKSLFMEVAVPNHKNLGLPIDPTQGWDKIAPGNVFDADKWEQHQEDARLAHGSGYDLLSVAEDRMKKLESSGAGLEQYREILSMLEAALIGGISPNTKAIVHKRIGEIQHKFGRDADAIQHFETAIKLNPKVGVKKLLDSLQKQRPTSPL